MTTASLALVPYAERGDIPERLGVDKVEASVSWLIVAEVLAELRESPGDVIEGRTKA